MEQDLSNYRKSYGKEKLLEENLKENPLEFFRDWFLEADSDERITKLTQ